MSRSVKMTLLRVAVVLFVFYFVTLFNGASFKDRKREGKGRSSFYLSSSDGQLSWQRSV